MAKRSASKSGRASRSPKKGGGLVCRACPEMARVRSRRTALISGQEIFAKPDLPVHARARGLKAHLRSRLPLEIRPYRSDSARAAVLAVSRRRSQLSPEAPHEHVPFVVGVAGDEVRGVGGKRNVLTVTRQIWTPVDARVALLPC